MPRDADIAEISQIFVSATAQDCKQFREDIRDVIHDNLVAAKIFLQENWAEVGFVVDKCKERVCTCDAYVGLFGHRYGYVPPGHTKSVTELEFRWAVDRWPQPVSPLFVLLPEANSEADKKLRAWARPFLEREYPDPASRADAERAHQDFLAAVKAWASDGRLLIYYRNRAQLIGKALSCIQNWNQSIYRRASQGRRQSAGDIPADELGRISWNQRDELAKALEAFRDRPTERAACFLLHGPENHGQCQFAEFLCRSDEWDDMQVHCGQAAEADSIESLLCWACAQLKEPVLGAAGVDALAGVLATRLMKTSVVLIVRHLGWKPDRLSRFQQQFWKPLVDALAARSPGGTGRLYAFVVEHEKLPTAGQSGIRPDDLSDAGVDYHDLLALPALADIPAAHVRRWLKELKATAGIALSEARREEIAERVTKPDANPPNVYDRLSRERFWADPKN